MTYRLGNTKKQNKVSYRLVVSGIALICFFFWPTLKIPLSFVIDPLSARVFELTSFGIRFVPDFFVTYTTSRKELMKERDDLVRRVEALENTSKEQELLLRQYKNITVGTSTDYISYNIATSLAQDVTYLYSTIIFSKGFSDGIEEGNYVFLRGKSLVCRIMDVSSKMSKCKLYTAFGEKVSAVSASSSINLTLEGRGGHYIANVVRESPVYVGEEILLRENQTYSLGHVTSIIRNDQDTSWRLLIQSPYSPDTSSLFYIAP